MGRVLNTSIAPRSSEKLPIMSHVVAGEPVNAKAPLFVCVPCTCAAGDVVDAAGVPAATTSMGIETCTAPSVVATTM